jgi:hypothetical protein
MVAEPELEVSCVTGLPARTINRSCRFFAPKLTSPSKFDGRIRPPVLLGLGSNLVFGLQ